MLKVIKAGFFTSIQDLGRYGFRDKGVPVSGAMDLISASRVNSLLENEEKASVLEITMTGPQLKFEEDTYICVSGARLSPSINNEPFENNTIIKIQKGDIISFGKLEKGFRAYLGVKGGFMTAQVLGSASFYFPLTERACIDEYMELLYEPTTDFKPKIPEMKINGFFDQGELEVERGPEFELLNKTHLDKLFSDQFTISKENNRMAYQLKEYIEGHSQSMLTSATLPGTVQLTPSGKVIILMKDGQTTGGYPRILQLTERSISILAQKKFGDTLRLKLI